MGYNVTGRQGEPTRRWVPGEAMQGLTEGPAAAGQRLGPDHMMSQGAGSVTQLGQMTVTLYQHIQTINSQVDRDQTEPSLTT